MIALIQRVTQANVTVSNQQIAKIGTGLLALIAIERDDEQQQADRLLQKLLAYRVFEDKAGKMNLSLTDTQSDLLLVPQFTLAADTHKGLRPNFTPAASPDKAEMLFTYLARQAQQQHPVVATGQFAADMQVSLTNDGPVTFWLNVSPQSP